MISGGVMLLTIVGIITAVHIHTPKISIVVNENGTISLKHNLDHNKYTVVWETDAGNITPVEDNDDYSYQPENQYYAYTNLNDASIWSKTDADGYEYTAATIRANVFEYGNYNTGYNRCSDKYYMDEISLQKVDDTVRQISKRKFGNPVRADGETNWQQIITIDKQMSYITLRYRSGESMDSKEICWQTNVTPLSTAFFQGAPIYIFGAYNNEPYVVSEDTVCFDFYGNHRYNNDDRLEFVFEAFLVDKRYIDKNIPSKTHAQNMLIKMKYILWSHR